MAIRLHFPPLSFQRASKPTENAGGDELSAARRKAVVESHHLVTVEALRTLCEEFLPFRALLEPAEDAGVCDEDGGTAFHHAITHDHVHVLYSHARNAGLWLLPDGGVGPLEPRELRVLKQIVESAH